MAQTSDVGLHRLPIDLASQGAKRGLEHLDRLPRAGQRISQHSVESPEQGLVEASLMIRRSDHDALRAGALQEEQERTQDSSGLTDVVARTVAAQRVELIE